LEKYRIQNAKEKLEAADILIAGGLCDEFGDRGRNLGSDAKIWFFWGHITQKYTKKQKPANVTQEKKQK
jgi:hypothetical protein